MADLKYIAFLVVLYLFFKYGPIQLVNRLIMLVIGKGGLESVGQKALAQQPDTITLHPGAAPSKPAARTALTMLRQRGFESAGSFAIPEMKGVSVHLLVKPADAAVAVVYEHAQAGSWVDVSTRYADGTSFTLTNTLMGGGLDEMPGHTTVRAPKQSPVVLAARLLQERPAGEPIRITAAEFPRAFEKAYEESTAWRKGKGLRADEVKRAGLERRTA